MIVKEIKRTERYYYAFDGKSFKNKEDCISHENRLKMGISEIKDIAFIEYCLDDRILDSKNLVPYVFTANPNYSLLDYYKACNMHKLSSSSSFEPMVYKYDMPEYLTSKGKINETNLIPGKKYILLYYKYVDNDPYECEEIVILDELDRVKIYLTEAINRTFLI